MSENEMSLEGRPIVPLHVGTSRYRDRDEAKSARARPQSSIACLTEAVGSGIGIAALLFFEMTATRYQQEREAMVEEQLRRRGISDQRVLAAMEEVPRHLFVPPESWTAAYEDHPLPIGQGQTISQPYIVALMLQALELTGQEWALEIGAGSGYQAAVLSKLTRHVYTVEIIPELAESARTVLTQLHYDNVEVVAANGSIGWKAGAPYDAIIVAAASPTVPHALIEQLRDGGRLLLPVGSLFQQNLLRIRKWGKDISTENLGGCAFVPLVGEEGWKSGERSS